MRVTIVKSKKPQKARMGIARILDRYSLTMPEVIGGINSGVFNSDEAAWKAVEPDYMRARESVFARMYPGLWRKLKKRKSR